MSHAPAARRDLDWKTILTGGVVAVLAGVLTGVLIFKLATAPPRADVPSNLAQLQLQVDRVLHRHDVPVRWTLIPQEHGPELLCGRHPQFMILLGPDWLRMIGAKGDLDPRLTADIALETILAARPTSARDPVLQNLVQDYCDQFTQTPYDSSVHPLIRNSDHRTYFGDHQVLELVPRNLVPWGTMLVLTVAERDHYVEALASVDSCPGIWSAETMVRFWEQSPPVSQRIFTLEPLPAE